MLAQRNKGNHKNSFLIIVPKHICPGPVGANSSSLITTQARGAGLACLAFPPGPGLRSPPLAPTGFPELSSALTHPALCRPCWGFRQTLHLVSLCFFSPLSLFTVMRSRLFLLPPFCFLSVCSCFHLLFNCPPVHFPSLCWAVCHHKLPIRPVRLVSAAFSSLTGALRVAWLPFLTEKVFVVVDFVLFSLSSICVSPCGEMGYLYTFQESYFLNERVASEFLGLPAEVHQW